MVVTTPRLALLRGLLFAIISVRSLGAAGSTPSSAEPQVYPRASSPTAKSVRPAPGWVATNPRSTQRLRLPGAAPHQYLASAAPGLPVRLHDQSQSAVKLVDLDRDGKNDLVLTTTGKIPDMPGASAEGQVHVLSPSGTALPGWPFRLPTRPLTNTPAVGDIDGDGDLDVVVLTLGDVSEPSTFEPFKLWALTATGTIKPGFPVSLNVPGDGWGTGFFTNGETPSPTLVDLDGNGVPEIVAVIPGSAWGTEAGVVVAVSGDARVLFRRVLPRSVPPGDFFDEFVQNSVPTVAHLTGRALPDLVVCVYALRPNAAEGSTTYLSVFALSPSGDILPGWPVRVPPGAANGIRDILDTGIAADLDRDGRDEFILSAPEYGAVPPRLHVIASSGSPVPGFPRDLPTVGDSPSYPSLADVDGDGYLDIVTLVPAHPARSDKHFLTAHNRFGNSLAQTAIPAIINGDFGQQLRQTRISLAEDASGRTCAVFPISQWPPNQANLQVNAWCIDGAAVPGYATVLPSLCGSLDCQTTRSISVGRDKGSDQVYAVLVDQSANVRRIEVFQSRRAIPWGQFQRDVASSGWSPDANATIAATYVLPSSAYSIGANGAEFHTDLRIMNPGQSRATVTASFYDQLSGQTISRPPFLIPSRNQASFDNVLQSLFGRSLGSFGPIRIETTAALIVSSTTNNVNGCNSGAVNGLWLPGLDATSATTAGLIVQLGLSQNPNTGYRSNLVFINPGAQVAMVDATLRRGDGSLVGSAKIGPLPANGFRQVSLGSFPGTSGLTDTGLYLEFAADQPILAFASVIGNASGDPFAIVASPDPRR